ISDLSLRSMEEYSGTSIDLIELKNSVSQKLKGLFSEKLKIPGHTVELDESFASYGLNSLVITALNKELDDVFNELPKTLFYEYDTLRSLCSYLAEDHTKECISWTGYQNLQQLKASSNIVSSNSASRLNHSRIKSRADV